MSRVKKKNKKNKIAQPQVNKHKMFAIVINLSLAKRIKYQFVIQNWVSGLMFIARSENKLGRASKLGRIIMNEL